MTVTEYNSNLRSRKNSLPMSQQPSTEKPALNVMLKHKAAESLPDLRGVKSQVVLRNFVNAVREPHSNLSSLRSLGYEKAVESYGQ